MTMPEARTSVEVRAWFWWFVRSLCGEGTLESTERNVLGVLPVPVRSALLRAVQEIDPGALESLDVRRAGLHAEDGNYVWVHSWRFAGGDEPTVLRRTARRPSVALDLVGSFLEEFRAWQRAFLSLLRLATEQGVRQLRVGVTGASLPVVELAVADALATVEQASEFYGITVALPDIELLCASPRHVELAPFVSQAYRDHDGTVFVDLPRTPFACRVVDRLPGQGIVFLDGWQSDSSEIFEDSWSSAEQSLRLAALQQRPVGLRREVLDFFARRFFRIPQLKEQQVTLIQRTLRGESSLGVLPTGFGKSLVFQLSALLLPSATLVISPLRSLMRDQLLNLEQNGVVTAVAITGSDSESEKRAKLEGLRTGRYRLVYVAPERLQIAGFLRELRSVGADHPIGLLVVDEAHCVSEWGHDFRPAYLRIPRLRQELQEVAGRTIPIVGLTATASRLVRADILATLELSEADVVQETTSDRPNLSYSVHTPADLGASDKAFALVRFLRERLPRTLRFTPNRLYFSASPHKETGIVFCIYANPHGKTTLQEGVHWVASVIAEHLFAERRAIPVHASTPPTRCPSCRSLLWCSGSPHECLKCGHKFEKAVGSSRWDEEVARIQDEFQRNEHPLLVATKGFGMGIDKPNIRYVVHYNLASGIEAYYQEVGRAGRDGEHAHAALLYRPPHPDCRPQIAAALGGPPCVIDRQAYRFYRCPFGLATLCDYGLQARFIRASYPGVMEDTAETLQHWRLVREGRPIVVRTSQDDEELTRVQLALYRLQLLGLVQDFSLTYQRLTEVQIDVVPVRDWRTEDVLEGLRKYLQRTSVVLEQLSNGSSGSGAVSDLSVAFEGLVRQSRSLEREELVRRAVTILLTRIYQVVPPMRYQMLLNELDYATSHERGECRRLVLLARFDTTPPPDTYRCGFCDVCVPDLVFPPGKRAELPLVDVGLEELARRLPELLERYDGERLRAFVEAVERRGGVAGMLARVTTRLEQEATNVAALYLAGALARRRPGREREAWGYLERGIAEAIRQGLSREALLEFAEEAAELDALQTLVLLTGTGGPFDSLEGRQELLEYAVAALGEEAFQTRLLLALLASERFLQQSEAILLPLERALSRLASTVTFLEGLRERMEASIVAGDGEHEREP